MEADQQPALPLINNNNNILAVIAHHNKTMKVRKPQDSKYIKVWSIMDNLSSTQMELQ